MLRKQIKNQGKVITDLIEKTVGTSDGSHVIIDRKQKVIQRERDESDDLW